MNRIIWSQQQSCCCNHILLFRSETATAFCLFCSETEICVFQLAQQTKKKWNECNEKNDLKNEIKIKQKNERKWFTEQPPGSRNAGKIFPKKFELYKFFELFPNDKFEPFTFVRRKLTPPLYWAGWRAILPKTPAQMCRFARITNNSAPPLDHKY